MNKTNLSFKTWKHSQRIVTATVHKSMREEQMKPDKLKRMPRCCLTSISLAERAANENLDEKLTGNNKQGRAEANYTFQ